MKKQLKYMCIIPIIISLIIGLWSVYRKSENILQYKSTLNWLKLYIMMQEDYYEQTHLTFNFRYFLPRTHFIIPSKFQGKYKEPFFNEDILNQKYGLNQTLVQKSIEFKQQNGKNIIKSKKLIEIWQQITQSFDDQQNAIMVQKKVDVFSNVLKEDRFIRTHCLDNRLYSSLDFKVIQKYISHQSEVHILVNRVFEIQKYLSKFILKTNTFLCSSEVNTFEIEILFTDHIDQEIKRPYVANIFNVAMVSGDKIRSKDLIELNYSANYLEGDNRYRIFKYDYDFRLKRVLTQCVANYKYHQVWVKQQHDLLLVPSLCNKENNNQINPNSIFKKMDILLMKKIDKNLGMIKNLTFYNFLENSDKVNNKLQFYQFSQELDRLNKQFNFSLSGFLPKTYAFNLSSSSYTSEEQEFMEEKNTNMWITKPLDQLGGRGIQVYQNSDLIKEFIKQKKQLTTTDSDEQIIVQKYIQNALLVNGKKFDIRSYVIVISTDPYIVYFLNGYIRLTINSYQSNDTHLLTHLVNTNIQKTHPQFKQKKNDSHWDLHRFEEALQLEYNLTSNEIENKIYLPMKKASSFLFKGLQQYLNKQSVNFQIFGLDFMFDDDFNPYFIEVNEIPQLLGQTSTHSKVCPKIVQQQLDSSIYASGQILKAESIDLDLLQSKCFDCNLLIQDSKVHFLSKIDPF